MDQNKYKSIIELIEMSSAHGYSNIVRSKRNCQKLMWILFTLFSTAVCIWFLIIAFIEYLSFDVFTNIQFVFQQPSQFPTVTFCSSGKDSFNNKTLKELIYSCFFSYDDDCLKNPDDHFEMFYSDNYKTCFRFNSGINFYGNKIEIKNSTIGGRDDSLRLSFIAPLGLTVWIHNYSYQPVIEMFNNHNSNMNLAPSGTETQVIIDKTIENKLEEPFNKCLKDVKSFKKNKTLIDFILKNNSSYSQIKCLDYCFELDYYNNDPCNCTAPSFDKGWDNCFIKKENMNYTGCTINYKKKFYSKTIIHKCSDYCPLECDSITYYTSIDLNPIENASITYIVVYYRSLKFSFVSQLPKISLVDLISNIGGIIGVFIGISFLSIVELVEIFTEFIFLYKAKQKIQN